MTWVALISIAALAAAPRLVVTIDKRSNAIHLEAQDVTLNAVLSDLAERLDIRLIFDGPRPQDKVTASLSADGAEALLKQLLEPRRVPYATATRGRGHRIRTLVVVTRSAPREKSDETATPTPQPFAESVPEPVLPDRPSPPDEP